MAFSNKFFDRVEKKTNVDKNTIQKLKDMLNYVPTGKNNHSLHFSFIEV